MDALDYVALPAGTILRVNGSATWACGWSDDDGVWWEELRRSYDDAVLVRTRNGVIVFDAEE